MKTIDQRDHSGLPNAGIGLTWKQLKTFVNSLSQEELEGRPVIQVTETLVTCGYAFIQYLGSRVDPIIIGPPGHRSVLAKVGEPVIILED